MAKHADEYAKQSEHINQSYKSQFEEWNPTATDDILITNPAGGQIELELRKPIEVQMALENRSEQNNFDPAVGVNVDRVFDDALTDVADLALEEAGLGDPPVKLYKLRALMLKLARDMNAYRELESYISSYSADTISQLGLEAARGQSTYRKAAKVLKNQDRFDQLLEAAFCAVYALFRHGVPIPRSVRADYNLTYAADPAADSFSAASRRLSLYALVDRLLDIIVEHMDLDRAANASRELRTLIGAFAHAADSGRSIENYQETAQHTFDLESAYTGSAIRKQIDTLSLSAIQDIFDDINHALLEYATESGAIPDEPLISYDLTNVDKLEMNEFGKEFATEDGRWRFGMLSFTDADLEFAYGLRLLKSEAQRSSKLETILQRLTNTVEPGLFMADRGFDGVDDIEVCRTYLPNKWLLHAQETNSGGSTDDFRKLRAKLDPGSAAAVTAAGYKELHPPVKLVGHAPQQMNSDVKDEDEDESGDDSDGWQSQFDPETWKDDPAAREPSESDLQVRAFYTDVNLPSEADTREQRIKELNTLYDGRARIESLFKSLKNSTDVATDTDDPARKTFYFNMSALFYNVYKLVSVVPAPNNGVELSPSQGEVLAVIQSLAFTGPRRPEALDYYSTKE